jgi:hypothetical protein
MQRTTNEAATYAVGVYHPPFDCIAHFAGLAVADLVPRYAKINKT